jgi:hypothetical protein
VSGSPQPLGFHLWIDGVDLPPQFFIAGIVKRPVVREAERNRPFVAHLASQGSQLRKAQMMRLARRSSADKARKRSHVTKVLRIPASFRDAKRELGLLGRLGSSRRAHATQ